MSIIPKSDVNSGIGNSKMAFSNESASNEPLKNCKIGCIVNDGTEVVSSVFPLEIEPSLISTIPPPSSNENPNIIHFCIGTAQIDRGIVEFNNSSVSKGKMLLVSSIPSFMIHSDILQFFKGSFEAIEGLQVCRSLTNTAISINSHEVVKIHSTSEGVL